MSGNFNESRQSKRLQPNKLSKMNHNHSSQNLAYQISAYMASLPTEKKPRVFLVEDQPLTLAGIKMALGDLGKYEIAGEATNGVDAVASVLLTRPDVVIMDVVIPGMDGIEAASRIKHHLPDTKIIMFTSFGTSEVVTAALSIGAEGYLLKNRSIEQITNAIDTVMSGNIWIDPAVADRLVRDNPTSSRRENNLSPVELQILKFIRDGMNNKQIADSLGTNEDAVAAAIRGLLRSYSKQQPMRQVLGEAVQEVIAPVTKTLHTGQMFENKYRIDRELGVGGAGKVYAAEHVLMARPVALKIMHRNLLKDAIVLQSFRKEAMAIACLDHENIIRLYDFGISSQQEPYLIMELFEGENLRDILVRQHHLTPAEFCSIFSQVCKALSAAHSHNIIHCDIKPSNILVRNRDGVLEAKLVDFGLAKSTEFDKKMTDSKTAEGTVAGTAPYMSPEQCTGQVLDERTDIYSLGCVMFEALTGERVFSGKNAMEIFTQHAYDKAPTLAERAPQLKFPELLENCIAGMLQKAPGERIKTAGKVEEVLATITPPHPAE
ncbi:MAG: response regulator [Candidatus Melainabacteria bacterium]|nr:MAG: response regulator [Candidatus Melainabacteria bacterium]